MTGLRNFGEAAALGGSEYLVDAVNRLNRDSLELIRKASAQMQAGINYRRPEVAAQNNTQNFGPKLA